MAGSTKDLVLILGAGPSAVFSYFGCLEAGVREDHVRIEAESFSKPPGAFWLRESPIPWPQIAIPIVLAGTAENYAFKQWGSRVETSADRYFAGEKVEETPYGKRVQEIGYDPTILLPTLYSMMPVRVGIRFQSDSLESLCKQYRAVILTFPLEKSIPIIKIPVLHFPDVRSSFGCVYGGMAQIPWVRQTYSPSGVYQEYSHLTSEKEMEKHKVNQERVFGSPAVLRWIPELPREVKPLVGEELKPYPNCLMVGRMATQDRRYLSHEAREQVVNFFKEEGKSW